jgi:uncharacterized protein YcfJ
MNKSIFVGALFGAVAVTAGTTIAGMNLFNSNKEDAEQASAKPAEPAIEKPTVKPALSVAVKEPVRAKKEPTFAEVLDVSPRMETVQTPRQVCHDEVITHTAPPKDKYRILGTAAGAALGGLVGNQFGGGNTNKAITAAGVLAGGYAGHKTQERIQAGNTYTTTEQRCETISETRQEQRGIDVTYRLNGKTDSVYMDRDPGQRIPVRNGQPVF